MKNPRKFAVGLVSFALIAVAAACGSSDSQSRNRNAALEGKQQCLSDEESTVTSTGLATLTFCGTAVSYTVVGADGTESGSKDVDSKNQATYQAASSLDVVRIKSFDAQDELVGEDLVTLTLPSCASGAACALGDTGPGGGVVVFDAGSKQAWGQYIELARQGWQDGTTGAETPSDDLHAAFGCQDSTAGTSIELGAGAANMATWLDKCDDDSVRAYDLVDLFNKSNMTAVDTWVLPTFRDLYEAHAAPVNVLEQLRFPTVYPNYLTTSSEDPLASAGQVCVYGFLEWGSSTISARNNYYNLDRSRCAGTTRKDSTFVVRPVHYFSSTGAGSATISIVGQMDIPVPPTTELTTTTTVAPDEVPAPMGVQVNGGESLVVSWLADETADSNSKVQVMISAEGEETRTLQATSATSVEIAFDTFTKDVEYTFVAQRVGSSGKTADAEPVKATPVVSIGDPGNPQTPVDDTTTTTVEDTTTTTTVEVTTTTIAAVDEVTTTVGEESPTTVAKSRDCLMAPWVGVDPKGEATSDDLVTLRVEHECMFSAPDNEEQYVISSTPQEIDGQVYPTKTTSNWVKPGTTSLEFSRHLPVGVHQYLFRYVTVDFQQDISHASDWTLVTVTVKEGGTRVVQPCDLSAVSIDDSTLNYKCSDLTSVNVQVLDGGEWNQVRASIAEDRESASADLSKFGEGWKSARVVGNSGANVYFNEIMVCISGCEIPKTSEYLKVTEDGSSVAVTQPKPCDGAPARVSQLQILGPNLMAVLSSSWIDEFTSNQFPLEKGAGTVLLEVGDLEPKCADGRAYSELMSVGQEETPTEVPTPVNVPVLIDVPLTPGVPTDLPAGTVETAPMVVDAGTTTAVVTPATAESLYDVKVAGFEVSTVEFSYDEGKTWIGLPRTGADLPLFAKTKAVQFRLTNSKGETAVISRPIDRSSPTIVKAVDVKRPSQGGSGIPVVVWILLALVVLGAAATLARRRQKA